MGPHTEITAAALAVLPADKELRAYLGDDHARLARDDCWMGDWQAGLTPFEKGFLYLQMLVHADGPPGDVCRHVAVTYIGK